jgi:uncharacterized protein YqeY
MLIDKIKKNLIDHIKSADKLKVSITRLLLAAVKDKEISLRKNQDPSDFISDNIIIDIINKMIKQRKITSETYINGGRSDLADKELLEAKLLSVYLPEQLLDEELSIVIDKIILEIKASTLRDMSKIMKILKDRYSGKCDFQLASSLVKNKLSNIR